MSLIVSTFVQQYAQDMIIYDSIFIQQKTCLLSQYFMRLYYTVGWMSVIGSIWQYFCADLYEKMFYFCGYGWKSDNRRCARCHHDVSLQSTVRIRNRSINRDEKDFQRFLLNNKTGRRLWVISQQWKDRLWHEDPEIQIEIDRHGSDNVRTIQ